MTENWYQNQIKNLDKAIKGEYLLYKASKYPLEKEYRWKRIESFVTTRDNLKNPPVRPKFSNFHNRRKFTV